MSEPKGHRAPKANRQPTRGQMTHLGTDVLAEYRAGLITGRRGTKIAAHLAGCEHCTAQDGQLTEVSALLAAVPVLAMPDSVAHRLDTVLAAEVAARTADHAERAGLDASPKAGRHGRRTGNRRFRLPSLRVLAPVTAAAGLLALGGFGLSQIGHGAGTVAGSTSAGRAAKSVGGQAPAEPAEPSAKASFAPSAGIRMMSPASFLVVTSHTNFTHATLEQDLKADLNGSASAAAQAPSRQERACVRHLANGASLIRVERAHYEGQSALVIVASTSKGETAWIAGQSCSATNRDLLDTATLSPGISGP